MKTLIKKMIPLFLTGMVIILFNSCEESVDVELDSFESPEISWNKLLDQVDLESEITFVQNGESIQDAINAALSGESIFIEPGNYSENLTLSKSDIHLIGLSLSPNDLEIKSNKENNIEILKLYDQKRIAKFKRNSQNRGKRGRISDFSRTELGAGIAHYKFKVRVGEGEFDVIRIHRVIRESRPFHPVPTKGNIFMVHGALADFSATFLSPGLESENDINAKTSAPFYLASKNIDVWGIDMGWTAVPNSLDPEGPFLFFKDWGYEKDAKHSLMAMRIARMVRGFSGQGFSGLNLLGFSSGNTVAYAAANRETQKRHMMKRHIKGIISVDNAFKTKDVGSGCDSAQDVIDSGMLQNTNGHSFNQWVI